MRIECPGCAAAYDVPEAQIKPQRNVRCARCGEEWCPDWKSGGQAFLQAEVPAHEPPGPEHQLEPGSEPEPEPEEPASHGMLRKRCPAKPLTPDAAVPPPDRPPPASRGLAALLPWLASPALPGWAASVLLLVGLLTATVAWRDALMREWPPSIRLYVALGVHPPGL